MESIKALLADLSSSAGSGNWVSMAAFIFGALFFVRFLVRLLVYRYMNRILTTGLLPALALGGIGSATMGSADEAEVLAVDSERGVVSMAGDYFADALGGGGTQLSNDDTESVVDNVVGGIKRFGCNAGDSVLELFEDIDFTKRSARDARRSLNRKCHW